MRRSLRSLSPIPLFALLGERAMRRVWFGAFVCAQLTWAAPGVAQEASGAPSWSPRFEEFVERAALRARIEGMRSGARSGFHAQIESLAAQVRQQHPSFPEVELAAYVSDGKAAVDETLEDWTIEDAIGEYAEVFQRAYPGGELDAALAELETPEGRKLAKALHDAAFALNGFAHERLAMRMGRQFDRTSRQLLRRIEEFVRTGR